jgi:glycine amidinotransferase
MTQATLNSDQIRTILDHQTKVNDPDYWHAAFAASLDEGCAFEEAVSLADRASEAGSSVLAVQTGDPVSSVGIPMTSDNAPAQIGVWRDWDTLKAVVIGCPDNDVLPAWYPSFDDPDGNEVAGPETAGTRKADYDQEKFTEAITQTEALCVALQKEGVEVYRPSLISPDEAKADPVGLTAEFAREPFAIIGETVILCQMRSPHRNKETEGYQQFFQGKNLQALPRVTYERNERWEADERPFLEGGDIFRLGKDVLVTMSHLASSPAGYRWLADLLEPKGFEVWPAYLKKDWEHGDYILSFPREGLCIAYVQGFVDDLLPSPITDWDVVPLTFEEANKGFAANGIAVRENVYMMPSGNPRVRRALEKKGVDVIEIDFSGPIFWQGSCDCATNELLRVGKPPIEMRAKDAGIIT